MFPITGAVIGILLSFSAVVFGLLFSHLIASILVVATWAIITGGLHLDGWSDCWDAIAASVTPERRNEIMKDSRLGTFGALALMILVALKGASVYSISGLLPLIVAPIVGRGLMIVGAYNAPTGGSGIGALFLQNLKSDSVKIAAVLTVGAVLLCGWRGVFAGLLALALVFGFRKVAEDRIGFINGDIMGAMCELAEAAFLMACAV